MLLSRTRLFLLHCIWSASMPVNSSTWTHACALDLVHMNVLALCFRVSAHMYVCVYIYTHTCIDIYIRTGTTTYTCEHNAWLSINRRLLHVKPYHVHSPRILTTKTYAYIRISRGAIQLPGSGPVFVRRVIKGGPSDGLLQEGDVIVEVCFVWMFTWLWLWRYVLYVCVHVIVEVCFLCMLTWLWRYVLYVLKITHKRTQTARVSSNEHKRTQTFRSTAKTSSNQGSLTFEI